MAGQPTGDPHASSPGRHELRSVVFDFAGLAPRIDRRFAAAADDPGPSRIAPVMAGSDWSGPAPLVTRRRRLDPRPPTIRSGRGQRGRGGMAGSLSDTVGRGANLSPSENLRHPEQGSATRNTSKKLLLTTKAWNTTMPFSAFTPITHATVNKNSLKYV